jgi:hypothetical protein
MNRLVIEILWWATKRRVDWLVALIYRRYCPYPAGDYHLARDCVRCGDCGCDNQDRYK